MSSALNSRVSGISVLKRSAALPGAGVPAGRRADPLLMKGMNAFALLELLRLHGAVSRSDLARLTGLSRPTVSDQVTGFIELGIVVEAGSGRVGSQGGKTPTLLRLNRNYGRIMAVHVRSNGMRLRATDPEGEITDEQSIPTAGRLDESGVIRAITRGIASVLKRPGPPLRIICMAMPGVVDFREGVVLETDNVFGWRNLPVRALLSREFGVPVVVENDVNLAALAELDVGNGPEEETSLFVELDAGIGAGVVTNGRLHRGAHWAAGEIAHMALNASHAPLERERLRGQLESTVGMDAIAARICELARRSRTLAGQLEQLPPLPALVEAARRGDAAAERYAADLARVLGMALANLAACYDPRRIVLRGEPFVALLDRIRQTVGSIFRWPVELELSRIGEDAPLRGAALAGLESIFESCAMATGMRDSAASAAGAVNRHSGRRAR